jgi:hypothetical protein
MKNFTSRSSLAAVIAVLACSPFAASPRDPGFNQPGAAGNVVAPAARAVTPGVGAPGAGARDPGINQPGAVGNRGVAGPGVGAPGVGAVDPGINQPGAVGNRGVGAPGVGVVDPGLNQPGVVGNVGGVARRSVRY